MNHMTIKGWPKKVSKKEIHSLVEWVSREMGLNRFRKPKLDISIYFKKDFEKKTAYWGWVMWEDCPNRPREFSIEIERSLSRGDLIESVIHELVHVKQYAQGRLKDRGCGYLFEGNHYKHIAYIHSTYSEYQEQPWEIEAQSIQKKLYKKYENHLKEKIV